MRHGRFITTALAVAATMAIAPSWAAADPSPLTDDTTANFAAGTPGTDTWAVEPGVVRLKRATSYSFDGTLLPSDLHVTPWGVGGTGTVNAGNLVVDGARVDDGQMSPSLTAPQTLEFRATFGNVRTQYIGFGDTFDAGPWAMIGTGTDPMSFGLYARTVTASSGGTATDTPIAANPLQPHTYRIEWSTGDVKFYVDDTLVATHTGVIAGPMRPIASDFGVGDAPVTVDWLTTGAAPSSATFRSRVLQADDGHTVWHALTATATGATFRTRSGNTVTPDASWSAFQPLGSNGAIQSPSGRYIQYEATLSGASPSLDKVEIGYEVDTTAPTATIADPQVSGTTATVVFSSPDADIAGFECSLDQAAYAACTSPKTFSGLSAGAHTVYVRPSDKAGNTGSAVSKSFTISAPAQGGGSQAGAGNSARDTVAPRVVLAVNSLRATKRGTVAIRLGCPSTETRCKIKVALKRGKTTLAHKTVTVSGGKAVTVKLQLSKAIRRQLARRHSLKVTAVIAATDAAGNTQTTNRSLTLRASA